MPGPEYIRRAASGAGVFRTADGSELEVDLDSSPYARELMARPPEPRVDAQAEAFRIIEEADAAARAARPVRPPRYDETGAVMADPGAVIDLSNMPPPPPPGPADIPAEWLSQAHLGEQPTDMQAAARGMLAADAAIPQRSPLGGVRAIGGTIAPDQVTISPLSTTPAAQAPSPGAPVTDYTGGGAAGRAPGGARGGVGGRGGSLQPPGPPTLDQLMVPDGAASPSLYGAVIDDIAGGPSGLREQERLGQWGTDIAGQRADIAQQAAGAVRGVVDAGAQRQMELEQERRAAMAQARDRYTRALERVQAMHVDPSAFFRGSGGFGAVGAALAVGLGAVGGAIAGDNGNSALPIIQSAIERDIEAQRTNLSHAENGLDGELNLLNEMQQEFESREAAEQATRAAMLQQTEARANELLAGVASDEVQMNGQALIGQLRQQYTAAQAAAVRAEEDHQMQRALQMAQLRRRSAEATRAERRAMGGAARPRPVTAAQMEAFDSMLRAGMEPEVAAPAAGLPFVPTQAPIGAEQRGALDALDAAAQDLEQVIPEEGEDIPGIGVIDSTLGRVPVLGTLWNGEEGRLLLQRARAAGRRFLRLESGGAITADEEESELAARGLGVGATEGEFREGWRAMRQDIETRLGRGARRGSRIAGQRHDYAAGSRGGRVVE